MDFRKFWLVLCLLTLLLVVGCGDPPGDASTADDFPYPEEPTPPGESKSAAIAGRAFYAGVNNDYANPGNQFSISGDESEFGAAFEIQLRNSVIVHKYVYLSSDAPGAQWEPIELLGEPGKGNWLKGDASVTLPLSEDSVHEGTNYLLAFSCSLVDGAVDCHDDKFMAHSFTVSRGGCQRDDDCPGDELCLQNVCFEVASIEAPSDLGVPEDGSSDSPEQNEPAESQLLAGWWRGAATWDGNEWTPVDVVQRLSFVEAHGTAPDNVYAVGDTTLHYNGETWSREDTGTESRLLDVVALAPDNIYAVGMGGVVTHFDGERWDVQDSHTSRYMSGVDAAGGRIVAVGASGYYIESEGGFWTQYRTEEHNTLNDIISFDRDNMFAVGVEGTILHYSNQAWTPMDSPTDASLQEIWGPNPDDIFAVGFEGTILHYNGVQWLSMESRTEGNLLEIYGIGDYVYAAGSGGIVLQYDGHEWSELPRPTQSTISTLYEIS